MFSRSLFQHRPFAIIRAIALCALLLVIALAATIAVTSRGAARARQLSFEDRVAAQRAIEAVYHRHRLWPTDNPQPKPALDEVLPEAALRAKIADYLRQSRALELWRARAITADELQAEMERMARQTRLPAVLDELWAALGRDPFVIAECLARPLLAERLLRMRMADCGLRIGECEPLDSSIPHSASRNPQFDEWWSGVREAIGVEVAAPEFAYRLPEIAAVAIPCGEAWTATNTTGAPSSRSSHTDVWTGSEMIVWSGRDFDGRLNTGGRYNPATNTWAATSTINAPSAREAHTAVWTGSEMIVWGGAAPDAANTGGRYNPATDTWTVTSITDAPRGRLEHKAVWTGNEMIIWGGYDFASSLNTGGRYNPTTNTWTATNIIGAPSIRSGHTVVWTSSEMIVWGGYDRAGSSRVNTGGRYNPVTNAWTTVSTTGAPSGREAHTAVWTGSEMIIWGGYTGNLVQNGGGRYNPATDTWLSTNIDFGVPRLAHTAVWTGNEMIVWGGSLLFGASPYDSGGRYNPMTNTWIATTLTGVPTARSLHTAVWTGNAMIVWGGGVFVSPTERFNTGGN